jgi:hypothetical protein
MNGPAVRGLLRALFLIAGFERWNDRIDVFIAGFLTTALAIFVVTCGIKRIRRSHRKDPLSPEAVTHN